MTGYTYNLLVFEVQQENIKGGFTGESPEKNLKHLSTLPSDPIIKTVTPMPPYVMASSQSSMSCNQYSVAGLNSTTSRSLVLL